MATWVLVDDSDPNILYSEEWTALDPTSLNATDDVTLSQDGTIHLLAKNFTTGSFFYNFTGTQIALFGNALIFNISKELETQLNISIPEPEWQCRFDMTPFKNNKPYGAYPLESYCEVDGLSETAHTLELNVTKNTAGGFWFDYLKYLVPGDQLQTVSPNATAWFDHTDDRLEFMQGWVPIGSGFMSTSTSQPVWYEDPLFFMNFNGIISSHLAGDVTMTMPVNLFAGSSVAWRALSKAAIELANASLPALSLGNNATNVTGLWKIDGGSPSGLFNVDLAMETVDDNGNPYSTVLFDTSKNITLTPGPHNLTVYYDGNSTVWPLTLDFLTVSNAFPNITVDASSGSSASPSDPTEAVANDSSKSGTIGGAVGGVLGGLLFLGLALYLYRRWRVAQRQRKRRTLVNNLEHNNIQLQNFE